MAFPTSPIPPVQSDAPAVVRFMQENKLLLEAMDADQLQAMAAQWLLMEQRLEAEISLIAQTMAELRAAGEIVTYERLLTLERYQRLLQQTTTELRGYTDYAERLIVERQAKMAQMGIRHAAEAIQLSLLEGAPGVGAYFDVLPVSAVENMVGLTGAGAPVRELLASKWPDAVGRMSQILVQNTGLGINPRQTARQMMDGLAAEGLNEAMTIARTEQLRVYREASRQQYQTSGLVQKYRRMCARQPRTCMACIALDGEEYDTDDLMELHPNDRCVMIPIVDGMPPIEMETGQEWFEKQSEETQRAMMGPGRYELYKSGQVDLKDLVETGEHPTWGPTSGVRSLTDLREMAGVPTPSGSVEPLSSIRDSFSFRESKLGASFEHGIEQIDAVLDLPEGSLGTIRVSGYSGRGEGKFNPETGKIQINNSAQYPEFSFVHESVHAYDNRVLPDLLGIQGARGASISSSFTPTAMDDFWKAVDNSAAIKKLQSLRTDDPAGIAYLLDCREVHARAVSQYIAVKSGDDLLLGQLNSIRENTWYPEQWDDKDFAPIARALDSLFSTLGIGR